MIKSTPHDRDLLDTLENVSSIEYEGTAWRVTWAGRNPLRGSTVSGRWTPSNKNIEVLYTSQMRDGAIAEIYYHLSRAPVISSANLRLHELVIKTKNSLDLTSENVLAKLKVANEKLEGKEYKHTQEISAAAHFLEFDSLIVPSARWNCSNIIIFLDRVDLGNAFSLKNEQDINWPAWRETIMGN